MSFAIGYLVAGLFYIHKHKRNLRTQLSNVKGIELKWLQILLYSLGIILVVAIVIEILSNTFQLVPPEIGSIIVFILMAIGIFYIGIHGIIQTDIFYGYNPDLQDYRLPPGKAIRTVNQDKDTEEKKNRLLDDRYDQLINYMKTEKPFLDNNLNLQSLATMLELKPHFLSMLINQKSSTI